MKNDLWFTDYSLLFRKKPNATAAVSGSERYPAIRGEVLFFKTPSGVVVHTELVGLPSGDGACDSPIFAFHIHGGGSCSGNATDPFANAGTHYNPKNCSHPYHAGDLPPLFGANGRAFSAVLTDRFTVDEIIGKTIVVHASPDDFTTQPAGNAGEKIACGTILRT